MKRKLWLMFVFMGIFIFIFGCKKDENVVKTAKSSQEYRTPVKVINPEIGNITLLYHTTGKTEAASEQKAWSKYNGKIIELKVDEGDNVKKDEVIALIDRDIVGMKFKTAKVTAPVSGIILRKMVNVGDMITPGMPLVIIGKLNPIKIHITISEKYLKYIKLNQTEARIKIDAFDNFIYGKVHKIMPLMDRMTSQPVLEIVIDNSAHKILPQMFAKIDVILEKKSDVIKISSDLIKKDAKGKFVYIPKGNKVAKKYVKTGIKEGNIVEITDNLSTDDILIGEGHNAVKENTLIEIVK